MKTCIKGVLLLAVLLSMSGCIPMPGMPGGGGPHFGHLMPTNAPSMPH
ncbi:hypothetical protein [Vibrio porteresiae]|uniref:Lipoprotein n=1 Tax=Vibrio porteresiae DSM 19223 TaxID=1123496 RepID=A0ABZ0QCK8_9VIBR|nr:hypothetical protein [Vibrio porteresiae]WPC74199.1 hypothetical protein R8Z52_02760 [Vibrio porteresiae DSM 19223]